MSETVISCSTLIKNIIKKTFQLSGREPKESIVTYLFFLLIIEAIITFLCSYFQIKLGFLILCSLLPLLPMLSLFIRRLHDHNKNAGFTLLPFLFFVILLPFMNFHIFQHPEKKEKFLSGGPIIELIAVLFLVYVFLVFLLLFLKGNNNENQYGGPVNYQLSFKMNKFLSISSAICLFLFICSPLFISENKPSSKETKQINLSKTPAAWSYIKQTPTPPKKQTKTQPVFKRIYPIQKEENIVEQSLKPTPVKTIKDKKDPITQNTDYLMDEKINNILNFLFSASIQSLKENKEISIYQANAPQEIVFIKALKGDVLFILKDDNLLNEIKSQHIDCQKQICLFKQDVFLSKAYSGS